MQNEITLTHQEKTALGYAKKAAEATRLEDGAWFLRAAERNAKQAGTTLEAIEEKAAAIEAAAQAPTVAAVEVPAAPACSVRAIRRFYAICKSCKTDTTSDERVRGAFSVFFGQRIETRKQLTTDMWLRAGDAVEAGQLVF